ncbi:MAG: hypothetical protein NNA25_00295 [Nitrospira sp.]|nr:hypothetical protein [Nitrospira sp.]
MNWAMVGAGCLATVLSGCVTWSVPPTHTPFFKLDPHDSKWLHTLVKKQEAVMAKCAESESCSRAFFVRALLGLYESREIAEKYFLKTIEHAPNSPLAASGREWLTLLREHSVPASASWAEAVVNAPSLANMNVALVHVSDRLVRDLLERETTVQQLRSSKEEERQMLEQMVESLQRELAERERKLESLSKKTETVSLQALQKQLAERDKKIEELSTQLEALKRIDQEMREKVRPIRPPSSGAPVPHSDSAP